MCSIGVRTCCMLLFYRSFAVEVQQSRLCLEVRRPLTAGTDNDYHHLHVKEVEILDENGLKGSLLIATSSPHEPMHGPHLAIDGDIATCTHTAYTTGFKYGSQDHYIRFHVAQFNQIAEVSVILRHDLLRFNGCTVTFLETCAEDARHLAQTKVALSQWKKQVTWKWKLDPSIRQLLSTYDDLYRNIHHHFYDVIIEKIPGLAEGIASLQSKDMLIEQKHSALKEKNEALEQKLSNMTEQWHIEFQRLESKFAEGTCALQKKDLFGIIFLPLVLIFWSRVCPVRVSTTGHTSQKELIPIGAGPPKEPPSHRIEIHSSHSSFEVHDTRSIPHQAEGDAYHGQVADFQEGSSEHHAPPALKQHDDGAPSSGGITQMTQCDRQTQRNENEADVCDDGDSDASEPASSNEWIVTGSIRQGAKPKSWISADTGDRCFLPTALFKKSSEESVFYMQGKDLVKGSLVLAADNETILEVACLPESRMASELVTLRAGDATLTITPDHRIVTPFEDKRASELQEGDYVIVDGAPLPLSSVEKHPWPEAEEVEVLKLTFKPDMPVAVFTRPPAIHSKGHQPKAIRRGRMAKRGQPGRSHNEQLECRTEGEYQD